MIRILFVDDEPNVLDGLRRTLRSQRDAWDMSFAPDGPTALSMLAAAPFDVIVSDMRMPVMDGATLLAAVCEQHPAVVRIILSGYTELEASMRAASVAHQFLRKPCEPSLLRAVIERQTDRLGGRVSRETAALVGAARVLPSAAGAYDALREAVSGGPASIDRVADIVKRDVALSARVLQLANSAFFGSTRLPSDIQSAVATLGTTIIGDLMLKIELFRSFAPRVPIPGFNIRRFERHSQLAAGIAERLVQGDQTRQVAVIAGLLHDIGKLVLADQEPERFALVLDVARRERRPSFAVEEDVFGVSHAEIGGALLCLWGLPDAIVQAVAHHHHPDRIRAPDDRLTAAVCLADLLAHREADAGDASVDRLTHRPIEPTLLEAIGTPGMLPAWESMAAVVANESNVLPA